MSTTAKKPKIAYKVFPPEKSGLDTQTYLVGACDNIVLREKNKKTVIGQVIDGEFVMLNDEIIATAEKFGFKPDETMLAEGDEEDEEVEEEGDEEVEEEGDEEVEEEGDAEEEGDEEVEEDGDAEEEGDAEGDAEEEGDEDVEEKGETTGDMDTEEVGFTRCNEREAVQIEDVDVAVSGSSLEGEASLALQKDISTMIKALNKIATDTCNTLNARDSTVTCLETQNAEKDSLINKLQQDLNKTKKELSDAKKKLDGLKQLLS